MPYTIQKQKKVQADKTASPKSTGFGLQNGMPNSAALSLLGAGLEAGGSSVSDLGARIQARQPVLIPRRQAQIPQAEQEADRLAAAVTGGTPEGVKAAMARRLGSDFSGVRFHTDDTAAKKASDMGARAFTSGADIYFGPGGFDPGVAAHELVHTVQQGMVDSSVVSASTPAGGIQMQPGDEDEKKKKKESKGGLGNRIYDRTIGRMFRWNKEAIDELHDVKTVREDGTRLWDELTKSQKLRWKMRNPIAYARYQKSEKVRQKAEARVHKRKLLDSAAGDFLEKKWASGEVRGSLLRDPPKAAAGNGAAAQGGGKQSAKDSANYTMGPARAAVRSGSGKNAGGDDPVLDEVSELLDMSGGINEDFVKNKGVEVAAGLGQNVIAFSNSGTGMADAIQGHRYGEAALHGLDLGINSLSTIENLGKFIPGMDFLPEGLSEIAQSGKDTIEAFINMKDGRPLDIATSFLDVGDNMLNIYDKTSKLVPSMPTLPNGATDVAAGVKNFIQGTKEAAQGGAQKRASGRIAERLQGGQERNALDDDKLLKHDIAMQGKRQGQIMEASGAGKAVEGVFQGTAGAAQLSGVGAVATPILKGLAYGTRASTKIATTALHNKMKGEVTEQTTGINDDMIAEYLKEHDMVDNAKNRREVKRSMMRSVGYETGYREELLADQSTKRARKIAAGAKAGDADYMEIAEALGARRGKPGDLNAEALQARLGGDRTRGQVVASSLRAKAMAKGNLARRSRRQAAAEQRVETLRQQLTAANNAVSSSTGGANKQALKNQARLQKQLDKAEKTLQKRNEHNTKRNAARDEKIRKAKARQDAERARWRAASNTP